MSLRDLLKTWRKRAAEYDRTFKEGGSNAYNAAAQIYRACLGELQSELDAVAGSPLEAFEVALDAAETCGEALDAELLGRIEAAYARRATPIGSYWEKIAGAMFDEGMVYEVVEIEDYGSVRGRLVAATLKRAETYDLGTPSKGFKLSSRLLLGSSWLRRETLDGCVDVADLLSNAVGEITIDGRRYAVTRADIEISGDMTLALAHQINNDSQRTVEAVAVGGHLHLTSSAHRVFFDVAPATEGCALELDTGTGVQTFRERYAPRWYAVDVRDGARGPFMVTPAPRRSRRRR